MIIIQRIPGLIPVIISTSLLNLFTPVRLQKHYYIILIFKQFLQNKNMPMPFHYVYYSR